MESGYEFKRSASTTYLFIQHDSTFLELCSFYVCFSRSFVLLKRHLRKPGEPHIFPQFSSGTETPHIHACARMLMHIRRCKRAKVKTLNHLRRTLAYAWCIPSEKTYWERGWMVVAVMNVFSSQKLDSSTSALCDPEQIVTSLHPRLLTYKRGRRTLPASSSHYIRPGAQSRARGRGAGKPRRPRAPREWAEDVLPGHQDCSPIFRGEFRTNCGVFCKVNFAAFYNEKQLSHLLSCHIRAIERTVGLEKLSCPSSKSRFLSWAT